MQDKYREFSRTAFVVDVWLLFMQYQVQPLYTVYNRRVEEIEEFINSRSTRGNAVQIFGIRPNTWNTCKRNLIQQNFNYRFLGFESKINIFAERQY